MRRPQGPRLSAHHVRALVEVGAASADHLERISEEGIGKLAAAGVVAVSLPFASLYLGVAPLLDLKRAGVNLALGCDNCSCSDCQNLFQAMKMFALLCAGMDGEPSGICASAR